MITRRTHVRRCRTGKRCIVRRHAVKRKRVQRRYSPEKAIAGKKCYNCGKTFGDEPWYYYYHGDQDDRVCKDCAKKLKHGDTIYEGLSVYDYGN